MSDDKLKIRDWGRATRLLLGISFRAAPGLAVLGLVFFPVTSTFNYLDALWLKVITDGVLHHSWTSVLVGVTMTVIGRGLRQISGSVEPKVRFTLGERVNFRLDNWLAE